MDFDRLIELIEDIKNPELVNLLNTLLHEYKVALSSVLVLNELMNMSGAKSVSTPNQFSFNKGNITDLNK